jgi:hypothetical protein
MDDFDAILARWEANVFNAERYPDDPKDDDDEEGADDE